jgi:hypothetical protein
MTTRDQFHARLDKILNVFLKDETPVQLEQKTFEDGTVIEYESLEVGKPVMVIVEGQDPAPLADGEYELDDQIMVIAEGKIAEIKPKEEEEKPAEEEAPVEQAVDNVEAIFNLEKLKALIDLTKDGFYTISLSVSNGKIEWGNIYSESFQELKEQIKLKEEENNSLKIKFEEDLKILGQVVKETKVIQAPVEKSDPKPLTKTDFIRMNLDEKRKEKKENLFV